MRIPTPRPERLRSIERAYRLAAPAAMAIARAAWRWDPPVDPASAGPSGSGPCDGYEARTANPAAPRWLRASGAELVKLGLDDHAGIGEFPAWSASRCRYMGPTFFHLHPRRSAEFGGTSDAMTPSMLMPSVSRFMTTHPVTIDRASTLAVARRLMQAHKIRHLPVMGDGRLVGVVSEHDVRLLESAAKVDPDLVRVEQAMVPNPFIVTSDTALDEVTEIMAEHKYGSVIVMGRDGVEGIFTAIDACQALTTILRNVIDETA